MTQIKISRRRAFSAVPDDILTDRRISLDARAVLGYLVGRPDGWSYYVGQVQSALGITDAVWTRIRRELAGAGYYRQSRRRGGDGRIVWEIVVNDSPAIPDSTIPGFAGDGSARDGKLGDIAEEESKQRKKAKEEAAEAPPTPAAAALQEKTGKSKKQGQQEVVLGVECWTAGDREGVAALSAKFGEDAVKRAAASLPAAPGHLGPYLSVVAAALTVGFDEASRAARAAAAAADLARRRAESQARAAGPAMPVPAAPPPTAAARAGLAAARAAIGGGGGGRS